MRVSGAFVTRFLEELQRIEHWNKYGGSGSQPGEQVRVQLLMDAIVADSVLREGFLRALAPAIKEQELLKAVGAYALQKGEAWRIGEGIEIMDAYQQAIGNFSSSTPNSLDK
jgi:hypothetical protein